MASSGVDVTGLLGSSKISPGCEKNNLIFTVTV